MSEKLFTKIFVYILNLIYISLFYIYNDILAPKIVGRQDGIKKIN